ncbi:MAG: hypothetical protein IPG59_00060 [Candidatus Melainabacteria bacterium]|nr:MAG: hypothetical protein IPG59_00060 [Candidatus Melainabacteria bacterium]
MDRDKWEHLVAELVEGMEVGEITLVMKWKDSIDVYHAGGAVILRKRYPGIKPHTYCGTYYFLPTEPRYYAMLEAWRIVSPETLESGEWEYPRPKGYDWDLEGFASGFIIGRFERIEMFEDHSLIAFEKKRTGDLNYDQFKIAAGSEYAKYVESKVGKMKPGDIITFEENPKCTIDKNYNLVGGDPFLPYKISKMER